MKEQPIGEGGYLPQAATKEHDELMIHAGPKRDADRVVLLAHGVAPDTYTATLPESPTLAAAKVPSLRFNYPYRDAGGSHRPGGVLDAATRSRRRARAHCCRRSSSCWECRSMGGRYCSLVVGADEDPVCAISFLLGYSV